MISQKFAFSRLMDTAWLRVTVQAPTILMLGVLLSSQVTVAQDRLPRVLILGDRVYQEPAKLAAKELAGRVEVVFPALAPGEIRNSTTALATLDEWLGDGKWDLIHFNFGLSDIVHRAPNMTTFRVMAKDAGGVRSTNPKQYETNLHELVTRLKATGAKLVWASTTPIRSAPNGIFEPGTEIQYNAIAARVMAVHEVPINDMNTLVKDIIEMDRPAPHGWDPYFFDKKPIHAPIVDTLLTHFNLERKQ